MIKKYTLLLLSICGILSASAQYLPINFQSILVPKYMGSSLSGSFRLPVIFRAKITSLQPNSMYKYATRPLAYTDFSSTSFTAGAGVVMGIDSTYWKQISNISFSAGTGHDTFYSDHMGEYEGWFGFYYTSNTRFTPGKYITPGIALLGPDTFRLRLTDSIKILEFDTLSTNANAGTGIWGASFATAKNIVALYESVIPSNRPTALTYAESEGQTFSSVASFYSTNVNGKTGSWGTIIPNNLSNGIRRIEQINFKTNTVVYANLDADGIWGKSNKNTVNYRGGTISPIALDTNDCPLVSPVIEFWKRTSTTDEAAGKTQVIVKRRYGNSANQTVDLKIVGGTATKGSTADYDFTAPKTITFTPTGPNFDTTTITINEDVVVEGDEDIVLRLENPANTKIGVEVAHTIALKDNDIPYISINKSSVVKENAGKIGFILKADKAMTTPVSIKLSIKSSSASTLVPQEFKLGQSGKDSVISIGKSTGPDSLMIYAEVIDETNGDLNDSLTMVIRKLSGNGVISADSICSAVVLDNDGPAYVQFVGNASTVTEAAGTYTLKIKVISKTDAAADIRVSMIQAASTAKETEDFVYSPATQIFTIDNTTPDTIKISIPIVENQVYEPTEKVLFRILNLSNAVISKPDSFIITISDNDYPIYKIGTINKQTGTTGAPDSLNVRCRTYGTVYGVNTRSAGLGFTIMDNTGGIGVFSSTKTYGYTVKEGDSVMIQGKVNHFQGTAQLDGLDTIIKIASNRNLVTPTAVTKTSETTESKLVKMSRVKLINSADWPTTALSANGFKYVPVINTSGGTDTLNIDAETDIDGTIAPSGWIDVTGLGVQFDNTSPYKSKYYLAPRYLNDIVASKLPTISFDKTKDTISEPADSVIMNFTVIPNDENFTVDIVKIGGTAISPTDYDYSTKTISVVKFKPFYTVKANNSDDAAPDGDKTLIFAIRNLNGPGTIGKDSIVTVLIKDNEPSAVKSIREGNIQMSPNPSNGNLYFKSQDIIANIQITDISGKLVYNQNVNNNAHHAHFALPAGVYSVKVNLLNGNSFADKLVVVE